MGRLTPEDLEVRAIRFLNAPMCTWGEIPPGDGARLLPSMTLVVKLNAEQWQMPEYHTNCFPADLAVESLGNAKLIGVVIKTDQTRHDVLPGGMLIIAPNAEVEHVTWHGERSR